jgi:hypothetical protein
MQLDLLDPIFDFIKSLSIIDSIRYDDSHCITIVSLSERFELLLSCGIPYLKFQFIFAYVDNFSFKIDANGGKMGGHKTVFTVST